MGNYFADNLKYLRTIKKLSQNKLAELANVNQATINRWEAKEMSPSLDNVSDLANVLNVSVSDLLGKDLTKENEMVFDELEILFSKYKDVIPEKDKNIIKAIIEETVKEIDKEVDGE